MEQAPDVTTPLGEPMNEASALEQTEDPISWHLRYWLSLAVIATIRGEDIILTGIRIDMEIEKLANTEIKTRVRNARRPFQKNNLEGYTWYWTQRTLDDDHAQKYMRDLDRMLVDKGRKMREYIRDLEMQMDEYARERNFRRVFVCLGLHSLAKKRLQKEEEREARVRNGLPNYGEGISIYIDEAERQDDIEMNDLDDDDDAESDDDIETNDDAESDDDFVDDDDVESDDD